MTIPRVLVIAGSDSGGGAGIQADIKTITMLGGHAMTAITAITAQNTLGVTEVMAVPAAMVLAQIDAVAADIGIDAIKIGMIGSAATAEAVADRLERLPGVPIVFDPVMIASSGATLAGPATIAAFARLLRLCTLATPNLPELAVLAGVEADSLAVEEAATLLSRRHGCAILAKGGHAEGGTITDLLVDGESCLRWSDERIETRHSHGTGCTLASAIATGLASAMPLAGAVTRGRAYVRAALSAAPGLGAGHGPMGHGLGRTHFDPVRPN